jgi:hypothetical protein
VARKALLTRPYHSPSSLALGARCEYAWALRYVADVRDVEVEWADIASGKIEVVPPHLPITDPKRQCRAKQRSAALGKAMHKVGESWYLGKQPDWSSLPGQILASGAHLLPRPSECVWVEVERGIGSVPTECAAPKPMTALYVDGLLIGGNRDLLVLSHEYCARVEISSVSGIVLLDYKSSSNIFKYALTADQLQDDVQCCAYALDVMDRFGLDEAACRWVYFETKLVRRARPIDVTITRDHALEILRAQIPLARRLDSIQTLADAKHNPLACEDFGRPGFVNCMHHISNGGTCSVRRSAGALIQLGTLSKKETTMGLSKEDLDKMKADLAAKKAAGGAIAATPPANTATPLGEAKPAAVRKPRASKATPEPEPAPEPEAVAAPTACSDVVGRIGELRAELEQVTAERDALQSELDAIQEALA